MFRIMHPRCGQPALISMQASLPRETDPVDWGTMRHLDGRPIDEAEQALCDSCGEHLWEGVALVKVVPPIWVPLVSALSLENWLEVPNGPD